MPSSRKPNHQPVPSHHRACSNLIGIQRSLKGWWLSGLLQLRTVDGPARSQRRLALQLFTIPSSAYRGAFQRPISLPSRHLSAAHNPPEPFCFYRTFFAATAAVRYKGGPSGNRPNREETRRHQGQLQTRAYLSVGTSSSRLTPSNGIFRTV